MFHDDMDTRLIPNEKIIAPVYGSPEHTQLLSDLAETERVQSSLYGEERRIDTAVNRSKNTTVKGEAARREQTAFMQAKRERASLRRKLRLQIELSRLTALRVTAIDRMNALALDFMIHKVTYPLNYGAFWSDWSKEVGARRGQLNDRLHHYAKLTVCEAFGDDPQAQETVAFIGEETLLENVIRHVNCYFHNQCDNTRPLEEVIQEGIRESRAILAQQQENARRILQEKRDRYAELKPFTGFPIAPKTAWDGNALPPTDTWACDLYMGFLKNPTPSKTEQNLYESGCGSIDMDLFTQFMQTIPQNVPVRTLGWRQGHTYPFYDAPMVYFEVLPCHSGTGPQEGGEIVAVNGKRLSLLLYLTKADSYRFNEHPRPGGTIIHRILVLYRGDTLVGYIACPNEVEPILLPTD